MSLHKVVDTIKKLVIGAGIGTVIIIILVVVFRIGAFFIKTINPTPVTPPNKAHGELSEISFPESVVDNDFSYILNTISGTLPTDFPDRLVVYPITPREPSLLNLEKARTKARSLRFTDSLSNVIAERSLGEGKYEWSDPTGINRKLIFDIITFDFTLTSKYLASLTTLSGQRLGDEQNAIKTVENFLNSIGLLHEDIDLEKTKTPQQNTDYNTYPKLFDIVNGALVPTNSLSNTRVIRVDLFQKDIEYEMNTGVEEALPINLSLPIRYPHPPFSTMSFWVASGQNAAEVGAAEFMHLPIDKSGDLLATYPIITVEQAFSLLESGDAYIAAYQGLEQQILIDSVYLAYYIGEENQKYLMPIIVFEGQDGFFAYVSAIQKSE